MEPGRFFPLGTSPAVRVSVLVVRRSLTCVLVALACCGAPAPGPNPHLVQKRTRSAAALGDLSGLEPSLRRAFAAHPEDFPALADPGPDDWLTVHPELPQAVDIFRASKPNVPGAGGRDRLYIQPLGEVENIETLRAFASDFFQMPVVVRPPLPLADVEVQRRDFGGTEQLRAPDLLHLLQETLPADAYALIGLTMADLYPGEDHNFVFGYASTRHRTGVFSLARYADSPPRAQERAFKVLAHEFGHMFGIHHCVHNACVMNGVNHVEELDRAPLALCPVCLRKLHLLLGFDPAPRYEALREHYDAAGLTAAEAFVDLRLQRITAPSSRPWPPP